MLTISGADCDRGALGAVHFLEVEHYRERVVERMQESAPFEVAG